MATLTTTQPFKAINLRNLVRRSWSINAPLTIFGIAMIVLLVFMVAASIFDHQVITGAPAWIKPAKFAISLSFYAFSFVWLLSFIKGHPKLVSLTANITTVTALIEIVIIVGQMLRGTTSHFNVSTPLDSVLWYTMAVSIVILWSMSLIVAFLLLFQRFDNPTLAWSIRLGILLAIIGMALAFLMTGPTAQQLQALQAGQKVSIIGAHTVGVSDGGPGLPILGWSTVAGDLRIPHFIGLHALQVLPLIGWLILLLGKNLTSRHRVTLVWITGLAYGLLIALLTWQALRGQSIIAPDALTLIAFATLAVSTLIATSMVFLHARIRQA